MGILSWNCHGIGQHRATPTLKDLVRSHKVDVVFLCETLAIVSKIEEVQNIEDHWLLWCSREE